MTKQDQAQLGTTLWAIASQLRGVMNVDDFRNYMLRETNPAKMPKLGMYAQWSLWGWRDKALRNSEES